MIYFNKYSLVILLALLSGCNLAPGSYPYAEKYEISSTEADIVRAIEIFKTKHPQYAVPKETGLVDGRSNEKDHWYHIYFYYPEENEVVYTWTRPLDGKKTTLALVSINEGLTLGHWKDLNDDFKGLENENQKKKFESRILKPLQIILEE